MTQEDRRRERVRTYKRERARALAAGTWAPHVDAQPSREHLLALIAEGHTRQLIAQRAGVSLWALQTILNHDAPTVREVTAAAVLGVRRAPRLPRGARVHPAPTQRRVGALAAQGWSLSVQARTLGMKRPNLERLLEPRAYLFAVTAERVAALYARTWDQQGGDLATRTWAYHQGWPPPMSWDDDELDDPDPSAHARALARAADLRVVREQED